MPSHSPTTSSHFAATRWSMVLAAGQWREGSAARRAMGELAQLYWFPLYAFLRRKGLSSQQSEDLVQGFFTRLLDKDALAGVHQSKGKFRAFLLASIKNYQANEWDKERAQKRGGTATQGNRVIALDGLSAETRYALEPADDLTPERVYERRWALAVLDQVLERLRREYADRGQGKLFEALEHLLAGGKDSGNAARSYSQIGSQLDLSQGAVKVAAHRLRRRYRDLLKEEISQTLADPSLVDEEIRYLLEAL